MMVTIVPRAGNVLRVGLRQTLVRVTTVDTYENVACIGGKPLHLAHGVTFDGEPVSWYVTDDDARARGWVA